MREKNSKPEQPQVENPLAGIFERELQVLKALDVSGSAQSIMCPQDEHDQCLCRPDSE